MQCPVFGRSRKGLPKRSWNATPDYGHLLDITERREMERKLREASQSLVAASKFKDYWTRRRTPWWW